MPVIVWEEAGIRVVAVTSGVAVRSIAKICTRERRHKHAGTPVDAAASRQPSRVHAAPYRLAIHIASHEQPVAGAIHGLQ